MRGISVPYEANHKYIDDVEYKLCSDCNEWLPLTKEYYYKNKSAPDGFNPYCKEDTKKRYVGWRNNNYDHYLDGQRKRNLEPPMKAAKRKYNKSDKKKDKQTEWQKNNPEKVKFYNDDRKQHKTHDITDYEWESCKKYFKYSCAYCGMLESDHYKIYSTDFHKEHVYHNGSNYIDNCVPSCKACNSTKHDANFNEWYNEENEIFSKRRLNKIINWMTKKCFTI